MIVGTAGHIDHGKTTLVRALTGVDTDRLEEEKARGISIELGFAYAPLPNGEVLGYIDVPGHERLVHTMAAGACGIDFALLVVAADDGVMPQTREHVEILCLLGVTRGAVALTKSDRADAARIEAVRAQVRALLQDGPLAQAEVFVVNAAADQDSGVDALRAHLEECALTPQTRAEHGLFRLAIDRVFTLEGHGTVVTGTVLSGCVTVGNDAPALLLAPAGKPVRVRAIHAQNRPSPMALAGQRCALNLAGVNRDAVARGDWIADARAFVATGRIDVELSLSRHAGAALGSWSPLYVHLGTARRVAHAVPLSAAPVAPGTTARLQLVFDAPLCAAAGDRFIVRDVQARRTIGGGRVLDPDAPARRRRSPQRSAWLDGIAAMLDRGDLAPLLHGAPHGLDEPALVRLCGMPPERLPLPGSASWLAPRAATRIAIADEHRAALRARIEQSLEDFHRNAPDEPGPDAARLRRIAAPTATAALWSALLTELVAEGRLARNGPWLHLPGHVVTLGETDTELASRLLARLHDGGFDPPWVRTLAQLEGEPEERVRRLLRTSALKGEAFQVVHDLFYHGERMRELAELATTMAASRGTIETVRFRDATALGRKRAIQILEFLDRVGLTRRLRDSRVLREDSAWLEALRARPAESEPKPSV